ncbi:MAG: insulinase family protein [Lachnospiraceae bacterium]|nr:insulinase family protein [Lachnospiraceae bacterium]
MTDYRHQEAVRALDTYEVIKEQELTDIHAYGMLLRHKKSGARVLLIPCADNNKVFNIAFRTPPSDSTGVPHIIEHTVLCGSEKFPLKDPFVELAKGSLNTFLNAMTFPDKTMYPVASTNDKDFHNLVDVYLDAVFHPNIYKEQNIFRQEGWTYNLENEEAPLTYNGVVYNEMKGVFSTPDSVLERQTFNTLFPDTPYGVESGGDPADIPNLTYEAFLDFHRRYYHPANSYLYLYGNMDMAAMLTWIDEAYLAAYDVAPVDSTIAFQTPFKEMKTLRATYPISDQDDMEDNTFLSYSLVAGDPFDAKEVAAIEILDYALFASTGAPVKEALIKAGIGNDVYGSFNDGILQPYYSIVAKGANDGDEEQFLAIIRSEIEKQIAEGIDVKALMAGINYQEFSYREADFGNYPKGLIYGIDVFDTWLYRDDCPFDALCLLDVFAELKAEAEKTREPGEKGYFEKLLEKYFLNNPHSALVVLSPEKGLAAKAEAELAAKLSAVKASLSAEDVTRIVEETKALKAFQEAPDDPEKLRLLPMLQRSDLKRTVEDLSNIERNVAGVPVVYHERVTNGIGYVNLLFDAGEIDEASLPYFSLLKLVLGHVSTEHFRYQELDNEIGLHIGGLNQGIQTFRDPSEENGYRVFLSVRMKAVYEKLAKGFELMQEILTTSDFTDHVRLNEILMETRMQLQASLMSAGHTAAAARAAAYYSSESALKDQISGIGFYKSLKGIEEEFKATPEVPGQKIKAVLDRIVNRAGLMVSYTAENEGLGPMETALAALLEQLPAGSSQRTACTIKPYGNLKEAFTTTGQVQFVAQVGDFSTGGFEYNGHLPVLRQMMNYDYLWQNIRVLGGAYGCGAAFGRTGETVFRSYRDPHLKNTLDIYARVPAYLEAYEADEDTMTKFIIGTLAAVDMPMTPSIYGATCLQAYMTGVTREMRQKTRAELLDTTAADIRALAPLVAEALKENYICVVGSEAAVMKHKDEFLKIDNLI